MRRTTLGLFAILSLGASAPAWGAYVYDFDADPTGVAPPSPWLVTAGAGNSATVENIGAGNNALYWSDASATTNLSARLQNLPPEIEGTFSFDMYVPANEIRGGYFAVDLVADGKPTSLPMLNIGFVRSALVGSNPLVFSAGYGGDRFLGGTIPDNTWVTITIGWGDYVGTAPVMTLDVRQTGAASPIAAGSWNNIYATGLNQTPDSFFIYSGTAAGDPNSNENIAVGVLFDNFTLIPEPASLGLLALGGLALLRRR